MKELILLFSKALTRTYSELTLSSTVSSTNTHTHTHTHTHCHIHRRCKRCGRRGEDDCDGDAEARGVKQLCADRHGEEQLALASRRREAVVKDKDVEVRPMLPQADAVCAQAQLLLENSAVLERDDSILPQKLKDEVPNLPQALQLIVKLDSNADVR